MESRLNATTGALALTEQSQFLPTETASTAAAAHSKALVEARYVIAKKFPRDWDTFREKMLKDCKRPTFAAVARYEKPIGKDKSKWPKGPSIRFAEAAVRNMTNVGVGTTTTYDDRQRRIVQVSVTDYEANVPYEEDVSIQKTIERRRAQEGDVIVGKRKNSYGDDVYILEATDDEIINKQRAEVSKVIRTLALRIVPGDIIDECMSLVLATLAREDAENPDAAKRKLFDAFGELGVRAEQIKEYLGHEAATLNPKELAELRGLYAGIRDGESTWRDVMDTKAGQQSGDGGQAEPPAKKTMSPEDFAKKSGGWKKTVEEGKKTANDLISTIQTKEQLTGDQRIEIASWGVKKSDDPATN